MKVVKVDLLISKLIEDLDNGLTWLTSEDLGNGSIQSKYNIRESDVTNIRKHPRLKNAEPTFIQINLIDDTEPVLDSPKPLEVKKPTTSKMADQSFEAFNNI